MRTTVSGASVAAKSSTLRLLEAQALGERRARRLRILGADDDVPRAEDGEAVGRPGGEVRRPVVRIDPGLAEDAEDDRRLGRRRHRLEDYEIVHVSPAASSDARSASPRSPAARSCSAISSL